MGKHTEQITAVNKIIHDANDEFVANNIKLTLNGAQIIARALNAAYKAGTEASDAENSKEKQETPC